MAKLPHVRFETLSESHVPKTRNSKHKDIVAAILHDLDHLKPGSAFKVSLKELGSSKANIRSALIASLGRAIAKSRQLQITRFSAP